MLRLNGTGAADGEARDTAAAAYVPSTFGEIEMLLLGCWSWIAKILGAGQKYCGGELASAYNLLPQSMVAAEQNRFRRNNRWIIFKSASDGSGHRKMFGM